MKKRIFSILLVSAILSVLTGCDRKEEKKIILEQKKITAEKKKMQK